MWRALYVLYVVKYIDPVSPTPISGLAFGI